MVFLCYIDKVKTSRNRPSTVCQKEIPMLNALYFLATLLWAPLALMFIPAFVWMNGKRRMLPEVATSTFVLIALVATAALGLWLYLQGGHLVAEGTRYVQGDMFGRQDIYEKGINMKNDGLYLIVAAVFGTFPWLVMASDRKDGVRTYC